MSAQPSTSAEAVAAAVQAQLGDVYPWLAAHVEQTLTAKAGRALAAAETARQRWQVNECAVLKAAGALPLTQPLHVLVGITHMRMERDGGPMLSENTIRKVLRGAKEKAQDGSVLTPFALQSAQYGSTAPST